jgi:hypothetical protein
MPYTPTEERILSKLIDTHGDKTGHDIFNKLRASGRLGKESKDRMMARAAKARKTGKSADE